MIKMVIADDEWIIRESLVESIAWHELGITISGVASNGIEAVELVRKEKPHLLLTDIRMPGLSGLDLIQQLKNENSKMKTVILTGFSEFSYAQQAIKLGVNDFVLKPVKENELIQIVKNLVEEIHNEEGEDEERRKMYVLNFLKGQHEYNASVFNECQPIWNHYGVICFEEKTNAEGLINKVTTVFPNNWILYHEQNEGIMVIHDLTNKKEIFERLTEVFGMFEVFSGFSEISSSPEQIQTLYKQALIAKDHIKIEGKAGCLFYEQIDSPFQIQELLDYIKTHYHEQISLQNLSATFYISDSYLSRIFKQYTGQNFIDYLTILRMDKAKELLLHSTLKTNEISKSVGYTDSRYFSQIFKKHTGFTPSEFRKPAIQV